MGSGVSTGLVAAFEKSSDDELKAALASLSEDQKKKVVEALDARREGCDAPSRKYVIAVCGGSCSGKTTIASSLAKELNSSVSVPSGLVRTVSGASCQLARIASGTSVGSSMQALTRQKSVHLDKTDLAHQENVDAISGDDFFLFDQYLTDMCPSVEINGRIWKDWESVDSLDWASFVQAVTTAKNDPDSPKYIVVEGFLALATPESRLLFDAAIEIKLSKEECWKRRKGRALGMASLPPGFSTDEEVRNYEVLQTYVKSDADQRVFLDEAKSRYPDEGELAWLRMYFDEVIWPAAVKQDETLQLVKSQLPVLSVDADTPPGKEAWKETRFPEAMDFVLEKLKG